MTSPHKYSLPFVHNYTDAKELDENERNRLFGEVCEFFNENPTERFFFVATGDTMIVGINHDDELTIADVKVRREFTFFKGDA